MSELREGIVRTGVLGLALGGLIVSTEACANGVSKYSVAEVENQEAFAKSLKDRFSTPLVDFFKRPTPTPTGMDKNGRIDNFSELVDLIGNQTRRILTYKREDTTIYFYLAEDAPQPTQGELDQSWDFLKTYTYLPLMQRFKPPRSANIYVGHLEEIVSHTNVFRIGDETFTFVNIENIEEGKNQADMTEYCQVLLSKGFVNMSDVMLQETDCNMFGIAAYAAKNGMSYEEYEKIGKAKGFVQGKPIELEPFSQRIYDRIQEIFRPQQPAKTPSPEMNNSDLRLYYSAIAAQIAVSRRDFDSFTRKDMKNVEDSFQYLKKTTRGKQKGVSKGNIIRGAIGSAITKLVSGAVV